MVLAGAVRLIAYRRPGSERLMRVGFLVVAILFIGLLGFYFTGGFGGVFG